MIRYPGASARRSDVYRGEKIWFVRHTAKPVQNMPIVDHGIGYRCHKAGGLRWTEHIHTAHLFAVVGIYAGVKNAIRETAFWRCVLRQIARHGGRGPQRSTTAEGIGTRRSLKRHSADADQNRNKNAKD